MWTVSPNLRVRSKPRVSSDSVKYEPLLPKGTVLSLLEGPVTGSGYWWYKVELLDTTLRSGRTTGWVAAGDHDGTPWIDWLPDGLSEGLEEPDPLRPTPVLGFKGTQDYTVDGVAYTAYHLFVANWRDYPAELFEPSADLEPCRGGPSRTRTWVTIIDPAGERNLNGFCALSKPADLDALWFALRKGSTRPNAVYVHMWDRLTDQHVESNTVRFTF